MDNCCDSLLKYLVMIFNFLFVLTGIALISLGAYIQIQMSTYLQFLGESYMNTSIVLIIIGCVIFVVAFFGCCGACTENSCMMTTFGTLLLLILLVEIGLAIAIYIFKGDVRDIISKEMNEGMKHFAEEGYEGVTDTWNILQNDLSCCGVDTYADWRNSTKFANTNDVPDSCCKSVAEGCGKNQRSNPTRINEDGCFSKFETWVVDNAAIVGGIGVAILVIQVIGMIVACCLARQMRKESHYV